MQLTLVRNDTMFRLPLPRRVSGQYWVTCAELDGSETQLISVEGVGGRWILKSNRRAWVVGDGQRRAREAPLDTNRFYEVVVVSTGERVLLRSEPTTEDRRQYSKFRVSRNARLSIGRADGCDIRFESSFVSARHAEIVFGSDAVTVTDSGSANGTFVNSRRVTSAQLKPGDVVSLFGLNIVIGLGFVAVNNPDGLVTRNEASLAPLPAVTPGARDDDFEIEESSPGAVFFRSPRFKRDIATAAFKIDPPPQLNDPDEMPLMMVLGPALTMGIASMFMGGFAVISVFANGTTWVNAMPSLVMSLSMMTGMILWPIMARRHERRRRAEREVKRQTKYRAYIEETRRNIDAARRRQSEILVENIVTVQDCVQRILARGRGLWERTTSHNDFLKLRLGIGVGDFDAEIKHAERKFTLDDDDLQDIMLDLAEEPKVLPDVPVALSLLEHPVLGIIGDRNVTRGLLAGMIVQLVALHSYDELKLALIYDPSEADFWEFARWLPHTWSDDKSARFVATTESDVKRLTAMFEPELARRLDQRVDKGPSDISPHYVVFALDKRLAGKNDFIGRVLQQKEARGFYVVALYDELLALPKECRAVVEAGSGVARIYDRQDTTGASRAFRPDIAPAVDTRELAVCLANTQLDSMSDAFVLPGMLSFLELHGVGKVEHLNPLTRWKESNPVLALGAVVGVGSNGEQLVLDVHEKRHGPHGLIAGMTGSGKSEFIMTYILSLAITYAPSEVAFVLIDYKGGGMANAFADLPHVAGTITNLDGAAVNRSLISIQSELKRRQAIFNDAGANTGTSNIDIYKYQSLYRDGAVSEPMPHLLIISDEFAELKTQQPEFMSQLVSAARIGRSLGVHLILATQKPSGVVDDQIWSNSRFRVCLKVQEKADSMEVIKRPDAAALTATGRFYIQVGFNELFEMGQSAWAGAPYYPADRVEKAYDDSVALVDDLGQPLRQAKLDRRRKALGLPSKQLDEVTRYLVKVAAEEDARTRPLWLDPIPELIYLDDLRSKYERDSVVQAARILDPLVGEVDDPANQSQGPLTVPLTREGNVVVYGAAGSGKTAFLTTMIVSLLEEHSPSEVHLYILDFEAETLRSFQNAPHVGDVLCSNDDEKVENLLKMLGDEITRRKSLFAEYGGDMDSYVSESGQQIEALVVVIHNYSAFVEAYDDKDEAISSLTREGTRYGIYFVLTAATTSAVRFRILQNVKQVFVLQLNDASEYTGLLGSIGGVQPSPFEGRGIFKTDVVHEFQTAHLSRDVRNETVAIRERCEKLAREWPGPPARRVPILPARITLSTLLDDVACPGSQAVPIGVDARTLEVVQHDFRARFITLVLSRADESAGFVRALADALAVSCGKQTSVLDAGEALAVRLADEFAHVRGAGAVNATVLGLFDEMVMRNHSAAAARAEAAAAPGFEETFFLVPALTHLLDALTVENRDKFTAMLLKCDASLGVRFVFADSAAGIGALVPQPWLKPHVSGVDGIWVGDGFADQYALQATKTTADMYEEIGGDFGYVVRKGRPRLTKLLAVDEGAVAEDGDA